MKERFIAFNHTDFDDPNETLSALNDLITEYKNAPYYVFRDFAHFLEENKEAIVASFTKVRCFRKPHGEEVEYYSRLSNEPMQSFNRKPKDYKRTSRGYSNFYYIRNRILWSTRVNQKILAVPIGMTP